MLSPNFYKMPFPGKIAPRVLLRAEIRGVIMKSVETEVSCVKEIRNKPFAAKLGLLLMTVIWGSAFSVVKNMTAAMPPSYLIAIRFGLSAVLMGLIFFRRLGRTGAAEIRGGLLIGFFNVLGFEAQTYGIRYTTAGNSAFLTSVYCVFVPFLAWAVKRKRPTVFQITSAFVCMAGVGLLSLRSGFTMNFGDFLSLVCGLCFAAQIIAIDIFTEKCDPILLTVTQSAATALLALPVAAVSESFPASVGTGTVLSLLYLAVFSTMIAFLIQLTCQKYVPPSQASLIMSLESVFGTLCGILFLGESMTVRTFFGSALIFGAIYLSERNPARKVLKKAA